MQEDLLLVDKRDRICTISLNRPEKRNALSFELLESLTQVAGSLNDDLSVRVIVIRGVGDSAFSAGSDIDEVEPISQEANDGAPVTPGDDWVRLATGAIADHRCPVIAMIYGPAIGAGCDLAAACDIRLAADNAVFGVPPARFGIFYHPEGIQRLIELVGVATAREMFFTGDFIDARTAKEIGLVNRVVPAAELESTTYSMAARIAANAPLTVSGFKRVIAAMAQDGRLSPESHEMTIEYMHRCLCSDDLSEGIAAFKERRAPHFSGG